MRPGYLRRNSVPYSDKAVMTEHFDVATEPNGWRFILLTTEIADPEYLNLAVSAEYAIPPSAGWYGLESRAVYFTIR